MKCILSFALEAAYVQRNAERMRYPEFRLTRRTAGQDATWKFGSPSWRLFELPASHPALKLKALRSDSSTYSGEAKSNVEVFRALTGRMGFEESCFRASEHDMIRELLDSTLRSLRE